MKQIFYKLLGAILPERLIRTLFISSLYARLFNIETLNKDICHRVNSLLQIAEKDVALELGMRLNMVLWNENEVITDISDEVMKRLEENNTDEKIGEMVRRIINITPEWLRYNSSDMSKDLRLMILNRNTLRVSQ